VSLHKRLEDLEERLRAEISRTHWSYEEWPLEDQLEAVLWSLQVHKWGRSVHEATDRELELLDALISQGHVPEEAREYFERMNPEEQPKRERWLYEHREWSKRWREQSQARIAWHREHGWSKPTPEHLMPGRGA